MKLIKPLFILLLLASCAKSELDYDQMFAGVEPCFLLYDLNHEKMVESYNSERCNDRISPCSTFKVALSLMGYDSGILKDEDNPKWEFKPGYVDWNEAWKKNHTPKSWMTNSVVWYSQVLTKKLGMEKFKEYVTKFDYGNQDLSGDPGKNNGLERSWLSSSLKISANEQLEFLKKLLTYKLPVSKAAIEHTKNIIFAEELENGWKLYAKTGSGFDKNHDGSLNKDKQFGWYEGFLEKGEQTYIFVINIRDKQKFEEYASLRAKKIAKEIFARLKVLR